MSPLENKRGNQYERHHIENQDQLAALAPDSQSGQGVAKAITATKSAPVLRKLPPTHQDYWKNRLEKRSYTEGGKRIELAELAVRIQHLGRRKSFALHTSNKDGAAAKARDIYLAVLGQGWDAAISQYAPEAAAKVESPTVGGFLKEVEAKATMKPRTLHKYAMCFRKIVADVFKLDGGVSKYDYRTGGRNEWLAKVEAVKLDNLTPEKVQAWKVDYLAAAGADPVSALRTKRSVNSLIRCAKSLFAPETVKFLGLTLPSPLPFDGIKFEKEGSKRYKSSIDYRALITAAKRELSQPAKESTDDSKGHDGKRTPTSTVEQYKILLLALGAGLRKAEIDTLCWNQIDWENSSIWIGVTEHFCPKSTDSEGSVDVDQALLTELRRHKHGGQGPFVISSLLPSNPNATHHYYRAGRHFDDLNIWLRGKGVVDDKPLHTLRKEFGSLVCEQAGIFAASAALRHSSIQVSAAHYVDKKSRVVVKFGGLLEDSTLKSLPDPAAEPEAKAEAVEG